MRAYDYWWGYTSAQVDLMVADQPLIVYKKDGSEKPHTAKRMDDLWARWEEKNRSGNGAEKGKEIDLGKWLRGEEE